MLPNGNNRNIYCLNFDVTKEEYTNFGTSYTLKNNNIVFNIFISNNDIEYDNKIYTRKCHISNNGTTALDTIIFSFNKETIIDYYKKTLKDIRSILNKKQIQLNESFKEIDDQEFILFSNPESLIKTCIFEYV
jgi:hypothetical protein